LYLEDFVRLYSEQEIEDMESFLKLACGRHSTRAYKPDGVARDVIERCVEAARLAPSACNSQPWHFIVVDEPDLVKKIAPETMSKVGGLNSFADQVPVFVVIVAEKANLSSQIGAWLKKKDYRLLDIGMAAEHFCLQAAEEGLGTCMLGWFNEKAVKKTLNIPQRKRLPLIIAVGHPVDDTIRPKNRKDTDSMSSYNCY